MKKRGFGKGRYNGIGGKVEPNETISEALVRECQEEIGVTPLTYQKAAELAFNELHEDERKLMRVHVYICKEWQGELTESEEMRPEWFLVSKLPYEKMWPDDIHWLPLVLKGKKLIGNFTLDENDSVVDHCLENVEGFHD